MGEVGAIEQSSDFVGKRNRHDDRPCAEVLNKSITSIRQSDGRSFATLQLLRWVASRSPLQEETILNLCKFHGRGAFLVVVSHVIDPGAYGIAPHQPSIVGLQQFGLLPRELLDIRASFR